MAHDIEEHDGIKVAYVMAEFPAEVFRAAADWLAARDGAVTIDCVWWTKNQLGDWELGIFYEPIGERITGPPTQHLACSNSISGHATDTRSGPP